MPNSTNVLLMDAKIENYCSKKYCVHKRMFHLWAAWESLCMTKVWCGAAKAKDRMMDSSLLDVKGGL